MKARHIGVEEMHAICKSILMKQNLGVAQNGPQTLPLLRSCFGFGYQFVRLQNLTDIHVLDFLTYFAGSIIN